ncbi:MAG: hypothetical protein SGJ04_00460 [Bacteroidota bacterium]|nr:hypothetical protein [Bacteroidota bacterium]
MRLLLASVLSIILLYSGQSNAQKISRQQRKHKEAKEASRKKGDYELSLDTIFKSGAPYCVFREDGGINSFNASAFARNNEVSNTMIFIDSKAQENMWVFNFQTINKKVSVPVTIGIPKWRYITNWDLMTANGLNLANVQKFIDKYAIGKDGQPIRDEKEEQKLKENQEKNKQNIQDNNPTIPINPIPNKTPQPDSTPNPNNSNTPKNYNSTPSNRQLNGGQNNGNPNNINSTNPNTGYSPNGSNSNLDRNNNINNNQSQPNNSNTNAPTSGGNPNNVPISNGTGGNMGTNQNPNVPIQTTPPPKVNQGGPNTNLNDSYVRNRSATVVVKKYSIYQDNILIGTCLQKKENTDWGFKPVIYFYAKDGSLIAKATNQKENRNLQTTTIATVTDNKTHLYLIKKNKFSKKVIADWLVVNLYM